MSILLWKLQLLGVLSRVMTMAIQLWKWPIKPTCCLAKYLWIRLNTSARAIQWFYDAKYHIVLTRVGLSLTPLLLRRTFMEWVPMTATSSMNFKWSKICSRKFSLGCDWFKLKFFIDLTHFWLFFTLIWLFISFDYVFVEDKVEGEETDYYCKFLTHLLISKWQLNFYTCSIDDFSVFNLRHYHSPT